METPFDRHALAWVTEPLQDLPSYFEKRMFGSVGIYVHGKLVLVLAQGEEPWNGLLVPTSREHHASLIRQFPQLVVHPVLRKWLYAREDNQEFEQTAGGLVRAIQRQDERLGVLPQEKRRRRSKAVSQRKRKAASAHSQP